MHFCQYIYKKSEYCSVITLTETELESEKWMERLVWIDLLVLRVNNWLSCSHQLMKNWSAGWWVHSWQFNTWRSRLAPFTLLFPAKTQIEEMTEKWSSLKRKCLFYLILINDRSKSHTSRSCPNQTNSLGYVLYETLFKEEKSHHQKPRQH